MTNPDEFKLKVQNIVLQQYKVEFLGNNFEQIVILLSDSKAERIYTWINEIIKREIQPIIIRSDNLYKEYPISQLLVFRYPFNIDAVEYRILFVKVKNSIFIEFHLGDHKYYDKIRKDLNLKRNNY
ncbi:hypothetical protein HZA96_00385 [Candidatus Woesearchaeota archaeon]|nr:hypothetical protein [Candidatus Woesearchaeota archaeon]